MNDVDSTGDHLQRTDRQTAGSQVLSYKWKNTGFSLAKTFFIVSALGKGHTNDLNSSYQAG
jgi:hypothetical protein